MTDEIEMTNSWLNYTKQTNIDRLINHLNSVGMSIISAYPMAEVHSWDIQKAEAEKVVAAGNSSTLEMAPFLTMVCEVQFGPVENDIQRFAQVREKAAQVKANADAWASLSAYVNGLRARTQALIEEADTESDTHRILHEAISELEQFRAAHNI
jgi:hypothetical protein